MFFSVVVPVHNKRPHVQACISSILAQTLEDFELLIVDDASDDGSLEELQRFTDPRIKLWRRQQPGPGGYAARNLAIAHSSGNWIAFLDADDQWSPEFLARMAELIQRFPSAHALSANFHYVEPDGSSRENAYGARHAGRGEHVISFIDYVQETARKRSPMWTSTTVIKRSVFDRAGLFPADRCVRGGDRDLWLRVAAVTPVAWTPFVGGYYNRAAINMVTRDTAPELHHCSDDTIQKMLLSNGQHLSFRVRRALGRLWNSYRKSAIKKRVLTGTMRVKDLRSLRFTANPGYVLAVALWAALPGLVQRWIVHRVRRAL
jgi:glycosyltransferase involved in cell wall biosynthesis